MDKDATSEEKLLKLIRTKKDKYTAEEKISSEENPFKNKDKKAEAFSFRKHKQVVDLLKFTNIFLSTAIFLLAAYFVKFYFLDLDKDVNVPEMEKPEARDMAKKDLLKENPPFEIYEQTLSKRDIFENPWEGGSNVNQDNPLLALTQNAQNTSQTNGQLKLVGIVLDQKPQAIVEDTVKKETFFLSLGEEKGGLTLEDIQENRVFIKFNGQKIELTTYDEK